MEQGQQWASLVVTSLRSAMLPPAELESPPTSWGQGRDCRLAWPGVDTGKKWQTGLKFSHWLKPPL